MSEPCIQLWTDDSDTEFAISLDSNYVVKTNEKAKYTKMIDQSVWMQGYTYDWKHTLSQWVHYHYGNEVLLNTSEIQTANNQEAILQKSEPKLKQKRYHLTYLKPEKIVTKPKIKKQQNTLKCHFCNLKYCLEEERNEHEKFWH